MPRKLLLLGLSLVACGLFVGCSSTSLTVKFVAIEPVNELQPGESRPVDIRIYQLKDDAKFKAATVDEIWENDKAVLADALIEVKLGESIFPEKADKPQGKEITLDPLNADCKFVGVLALYKNKDAKGDQKTVIAVADASSVTFELTGNHIKLKK
ncbi:MAG: type VI secretion system lipoprotein TssJ [Planctomycetes bacterium]|nr:type VI secretion system lipoprotein TssJ [Planctomycetota bacterium]